MITVAQFQNTIYRSGSYAGNGTNAPATLLGPIPAVGARPPALDPGGVDQHGMVPPGRKQTFATAAHADGTGLRVSFAEPTNVDDCVFLPFYANNICSAVVPALATTNVNNFFTAEMSGCAVYIDRVTASTVAGVAVNDLVLYHGNAMARCATRAQILANPALLANVPARNHMRTLHGAAMTAWGGNVTLAAVASCEQEVYMRDVWAELARKRGQRRSGVHFSGGTNVMGFRVGGGWQFWFQTWGWVNYTRPVYELKRIYDAGYRKTNQGAARIWQTGQFYP